MKDGKKFFVGGLINLAAGLGTAGYGAYQENLAKRKMAQADGVAQGAIRSQAARQRIAQQESDAQSAIDSTLRAQATAAEQIGQTGGSRALVSATPGLIRATDLASQGAIDRFGQSNAAIRKAEELAKLNTQMAGANRISDRLARAADAARQTTIGGVTQAISGAAQIFGGMAGKTGDDDKDETTFDAQVQITDPGGGRSTVLDDGSVVVDYDGDATPFKQAGSVVENQLNAASDQALRPRDQMIMFEDELNKASSPTLPFDNSITGLTLGEAEAVQAYEDANRSVLATGYDKGGEVNEPVEKTPGEFDHDDNPIDIMQEGAKIGEMTGGEYIFNPSQAKQLQKLAKSGSSDLHKFVKSLLNKPQFK